MSEERYINVKRIDQKGKTILENLAQRKHSLPDFENRVRLSFDELFGQSEAVNNTWKKCKEEIPSLANKIVKKGFDKIIIIGCGDSYYAGLLVKEMYQKTLGMPCFALQSLEYGRYYAENITDDKTLVIGLSASGKTYRTMEGLLIAQSFGAQTIGIAMNNESEIFTNCNYGIQIMAKRTGGCPTQATTATIIALISLCLNIAKEKKLPNLEKIEAAMDGISEKFADVLNNSRDKAELLANNLINNHYFFFVGSGPDYAVASLGAAKIKEMSEDYCCVLLSEEFHHYSSVKKGEVVFIVASSDIGKDRIKDTIVASKKAGAYVVLIVKKNDNNYAGIPDMVFEIAESEPVIESMLYMIPLQVFAITLGSMKPAPKA